jgi:hypothetical protein
MTDYTRMERHIRYNKVARIIAILCVLLMCDEIYQAISYHFPVWDDIALPSTFLLRQAAKFVEDHTKMYRIDD